MGIRISINIGQFPVGPAQPSTGQFVGSGSTPIGALAVALDHALIFYDGRPNKLAHWRAANALSQDCDLPFKADHVVFEDEDHYNCALHIHERHKGA